MDENFDAPALSPWREEILLEVSRLENELQKTVQELEVAKKILQESEEMRIKAETDCKDLKLQVEKLNCLLKLAETTKSALCVEKVDAEVQTDEYTTSDSAYGYYTHGMGYDSANQSSDQTQTVPSSEATPGENSGQEISVAPWSVNEQNKTSIQAGESDVKEDSKSIADSVKEVAQEAVIQQSGYVYDQTSGLYYNHSSGYYYDPAKQLYYEPNSGTYYYYNAETQSYQFHSRVDFSLYQNFNYTTSGEQRHGDAGNDKEHSRRKKRSKHTHGRKRHRTHRDRDDSHHRSPSKRSRHKKRKHDTDRNSSENKENHKKSKKKKKKTSKEKSSKEVKEKIQKVQQVDAKVVTYGAKPSIYHGVATVKSEDFDLNTRRVVISDGVQLEEQIDKSTVCTENKEEVMLIDEDFCKDNNFPEGNAQIPSGGSKTETMEDSVQPCITSSEIGHGLETRSTEEVDIVESENQNETKSEAPCADIKQDTSFSEKSTVIGPSYDLYIEHMKKEQVEGTESFDFKDKDLSSVSKVEGDSISKEMGQNADVNKMEEAAKSDINQSVSNSSDITDSGGITVKTEKQETEVSDNVFNADFGNLDEYSDEHQLLIDTSGFTSRSIIPGPCDVNIDILSSDENDEVAAHLDRSEDSFSKERENKGVQPIAQVSSSSDAIPLYDRLYSSPISEALAEKDGIVDAKSDTEIMDQSTIDTEELYAFEEDKEIITMPDEALGENKNTALTVPQSEDTEHITKENEDLTEKKEESEIEEGEITDDSDEDDQNGKPSKRDRKAKSESESEEESTTSSSSESETDEDADYQALDVQNVEEVGANPMHWPPCIRAMVKESDTLPVGSLYIFTCSGATIGREKDLGHAVIIPDVQISKMHCSITYSEDLKAYLIKDHASQNGTLLNGKRLEEPKKMSDYFSLQHMDRLKLGGTTLELHIHSGTTTCSNCEPGVVQASQTKQGTDADTVIFNKAEKEKLRRKELKQIKKKFGLENTAFENTQTSQNSSKYKDKASERRRTVGSDNPYQPDAAPASVNVAITSENKGHKMLAKMGWKEGDSLGKTMEGIKEPIQIGIRAHQSAGLGSSMGVSHSLDDVVKVKQTSKWLKTQERYDKIDRADNKEGTSETLGTSIAPASQTSEASALKSEPAKAKTSWVQGQTFQVGQEDS